MDKNVFVVHARETLRHAYACRRYAMENAMWDLLGSVDAVIEELDYWGDYKEVYEGKGRTKENVL